MDKRKFLNKYLPIILTVIILLGTGIAYAFFNYNQTNPVTSDTTPSYSLLSHIGQFFQTSSSKIIKLAEHTSNPSTNTNNGVGDPLIRGGGGTGHTVLRGGGSGGGSVVFSGGSGGGGGFIPGFVNETSKNSTLTNALGTNPAGQTACANYSYCLPYTEPALSGNLGIVPFQYANGTSVSATASDDKSDSYTCITGSEDSGSTKWNGVCYYSNLSSGAHVATVTFGTTAVTQVTAKAAQFYNIAQSSPLDTSGHNNGASGSTANAVSVTTTQANDLIYVYVCRAGTPSVTSFTAGSGFTLITTDINDGCASEYEVDSGTGSITPSMTMASASTYTEFVLAFKAASAGTPPSGWYADRMMSYSTPSSVSGNYNFQFPSSGNLLVDANLCAPPFTPSSVTDSGNTWVSTGAGNSLVTAGDANEFYVPNASTDSTGTLTVNASGTGDCTYTFRDFTGAPSSPVVARASYAGVQGAAAATIPWIYGQSGSEGPQGSFLPAPTNGMVIAVGGQANNTTVGFSAPSTPCSFDGASYGGMPLNGPEPIDQNNTWGHCYFSAADQPLFAFSQSNASEVPGGWVGDLVGFYQASATGIVNYAESQVKTSNTLAITVPATTAGNLLTVAIGNYNATARTVSKVCLDGTTCAAGNTFTQFSGSTSTGSGHAATDIWYLLSATSGKTTVTITLSASASNIEAMYDEVQLGGGSWATDGANHVTNGTGSGTTDTGASVSTSGPVDFCTSNIGVGSAVAVSPASGNAFTYGGAIYSNTTDGAASLLTQSATGHSPAWTDISSGDSFSESTGCFK